MNDQKIHINMRCPVCGQHPPNARLWTCVSCGHKIDPFVLGICPMCEKDIKRMQCTFCNKITDLDDWHENMPGDNNAN